MRNIKGPKSALTDFIQESNIKVRNTENTKVKIDIPKTILKRKAKKVKYSKPIELVNFEVLESIENNGFVEQMLQNINTAVLSDDILDSIAKYLSRKRKMSKYYFDVLADKCHRKLTIYDCSMIKDSEFVVPERVEILELFQCGQLTENTLNFILNNMLNLTTLRITGAFLIENFDIPKNLKILDVTHCSRIQDSFIDNINCTLTRLKELRLSYCYGLTRNTKLFIEVESLFICETKLVEEFYSNVKSLKILSIKRCPYINTIPSILEFERLDIEGIVTLTDIPSSDKLLWLNITDCVQIKNINFINLEYLKATNISLNSHQIDQILKMKNLKELDISWNTILDDSILEKILNSNAELEKIFVFGCFSLSKNSVELAYKISKNCKIIGNPSETRYLLEEF